MPPPKGSKNPASKLTESDVRYIRDNYKYDKEKHSGNIKELSQKFSVSRQTILAVVDGTTWGWLD